MVNKIFEGKNKEKILNRIGALIVNEAKRRCPVDNGILRNSLQYRIEGNSVFVGSDLPYASYVEFGTGEYHVGLDGEAVPHMGWDVIPRNGKALMFKIDGKNVFSKKVHIKGMHAQPFLRPAIHENMDVIKKLVSVELNK